MINTVVYYIFDSETPNTSGSVSQNRGNEVVLGEKANPRL